MVLFVLKLLTPSKVLLYTGFVETQEAMNMELTTLHRGRTYNLYPAAEAPEPLKSDMIARGWDGNLYYGVKSNAKVKAPTSLFYRSATSGKFSFIY